MIYALIHAPTETLGLIEERIRFAGKKVQSFQLFNYEKVSVLQAGDSLILMGGPMNVDETDKYPFLADEIVTLRQALALDCPILGVCLGAQLLAKALGAPVFGNKIREVGWHPITIQPDGQDDVLFKNLPNPVSVLHWHGDTFEVPKESVLLASSINCAHQAFRYGKKAYGLQFHLELTPTLMDTWMADEEARIYVKGANEHPATILRQTPEQFLALKPHAEKLFDAFLSLV